MNRDNILYKVYRLYADGFRTMTLGRVLWAVILIKLFVIFFVLKLFFFPDVLEQKAHDGDKAAYVLASWWGADPMAATPLRNLTTIINHLKIINNDTPVDNRPNPHRLVACAVCTYSHLPLALCAAHAGSGPHHGHYGNVLLSHR